jgi:hypothetical protein
MRRVKSITASSLIILSIACAARSGPTSAPSGGAVSEASVRSHIEFLASDALNGRASGTRDEWIAATYIAAHLQRLGLEPFGDNGGYVQTIDIERPQLAAPPVLSVGDRKYVHGKEVVVAFMGAIRASGPLSKFEAGSPVPHGAAILLPELTRANFEAVSPAAIVLAKTNGCAPFRTAPGALPRVAPRTLGVESRAGRPSCVALDNQTYASVEGMRAGTMVSLEGEAKSAETAHTWNAIARLAGSDPKLSQEVILLSAHLDHLPPRPNPAAGADNIFNGADDDASGSVAVLELAEALSKGPRPKRTIVFAWFGSEESGGAGSRYFADKPVVPLDRVAANLQFEMIGRPDPKVPPHTLWLTGYERSTLGPELARRGAKLVQDPHPQEDFFFRSDNIQFARRGVVAHTVSSYGLHKEYHTPEDEIRFIDFPHITDSIRSMIAPIRWLADSTFKPEWLPGKKPN